MGGQGSETKARRPTGTGRAFAHCVHRVFVKNGWGRALSWFLLPVIAGKASFILYSCPRQGLLPARRAQVRGNAGRRFTRRRSPWPGSGPGPFWGKRGGFRFVSCTALTARGLALYGPGRGSSLKGLRPGRQRGLFTGSFPPGRGRTGAEAFRPRGRDGCSWRAGSRWRRKRVLRIPDRSRAESPRGPAAPSR